MSNLYWNTGYGVINPYHDHDFVDTGMRMSFCRICNCDGEYSFSLGKYITSKGD